MMAKTLKATVYDSKGKKNGEVSLPLNFNVTIRNDVLLKAYESSKGAFMQAYGSKKGAGAGYSASGILKHRRHDWKSTYGKGISRIPRKIMSRHGQSFNWIGATVSNTRGGRRPHAPRSLKNLFRKINLKEYRMAINCAFAGTINDSSLKKVYSRHVMSGVVFDSSIIRLSTKEFFVVLLSVFKDSFEVVLKKKSIRAGKGTMRGRKYKQTGGLLFVIGNNEVMKRNGVDVVRVQDLTLRDLTRNGIAGRMAAYTTQALLDIEVMFSSEKKKGKEKNNLNKKIPLKKKKRANVKRKMIVKKDEEVNQ